MLKARLIDLLLGDNDRHPDQWRWARLSKDSPFEPIARDRDKVFVSYNGILMTLARTFIPSLVRYTAEYSDPVALFENATDFDRRILVGLDKSVWQSTADELERVITDAVIDRSIAAMPREYAAASQDIAAAMRARRDHLSETALEYYAELFRLAEVHGTDAADVATVTRLSNGAVDVSIRSGNDSPWFQRRFGPEDTREIRLYLHGGDDRATITGSAPESILVRVIGGNGNNFLADESVVGGKRGTTRLYDEGNVTRVKYARDTVDENKDEATALNHYYNRRPWVHAYGRLIPPQKDHGTSIQPVVGIKTGHGLGIIPKIGIARYRYDFRKVPYSTMMQADIAMSSATRGLRAGAQYDKRFASSDIHLPVFAQMSQLEVIQFRGLGNDVEESDRKFFDVSQTQWQFHPAAGYSFAPGSDLTFGPVIRYTTTDSVANRFISESRPYGFTSFGQAGVRAGLHFDSRIRPDTMKPRAVLDFSGSAFPGMWDAGTAYESLEGSAMTFITIPLPNRPVLALRAGGRKLFGNFPYFDAAFLGGGSSLRTEHRQRFAGDAAVFGQSELRVPIAKFPLILPLDVGAMAFADAGRVYVDGESPGGWHSAAGAGFWVAAFNTAMNVNVLVTNRSNRRVMVSLGFAY